MSGRGGLGSGRVSAAGRQHRHLPKPGPRPIRPSPPPSAPVRLAQRGAAVRDVADAKGDSVGIERGVSKRQRFGVALHPLHRLGPQPARLRLAPPLRQHGGVDVADGHLRQLLQLLLLLLLLRVRCSRLLRLLLCCCCRLLLPRRSRLTRRRSRRGEAAAADAGPGGRRGGGVLPRPHGVQYAEGHIAGTARHVQVALPRARPQLLHKAVLPQAVQAACGGGQRVRVVKVCCGCAACHTGAMLATGDASASHRQPWSFDRGTRGGQARRCSSQHPAASTHPPLIRSFMMS